MHSPLKELPTRNNRITKHYEAQGFVEALLAILITGIASVALMTIAAQTIGEVVQNEKSDQLTQEAVKGNNMLEYIVEEWNYGQRSINIPFLQNDTTFIGHEGSCYSLDGDISSPEVVYLPGCIYDYPPPESGIRPVGCLSDWNAVNVDDYQFEGTSEGMFRLMCITNEPGSEGYVMLARIYTGFQSCSDVEGTVREFESADSTCSIYEYISVFTVEP